MSKQTIFLLIVLFVGILSLFIVTGDVPVPFQHLLGQVGITVGVPANPYNTLDAELSQEQTQLSQEQADLAAREAADASTTAAAQAATPEPWYVIAGIVLTIVLVSLNFYLDYRRAHRV